jgi:galactokinase
MEYETAPDVVVSAPGIIRLLGEHTIGGDGLMIAMPLDRRVAIAVSARRDSSVRFFAADYNERKRTNLSNLKYKREDRWANFIKASLSAHVGETIGAKGLNVTVCGDIPQGLGLGSSVALQCAAAQAMALSAGLDPEPSALARTIVETDRSYFDRQTRVATYLATLATRSFSLSFIDDLRGSLEPLDSVFGDTTILLTDSKVPRPPLEAEIKQRSDDCATGLALMAGSSTKSLRDFSYEDMDEFMGLMPERVRRHCSFFVEEVQRVREAREAILHDDLASFSKCLNKSQAGLRNSYEISCPEIDWLVKRASEIDGMMASRMIGKGFGGCTLSILHDDAMEHYSLRLEEYERIFGFKPNALEISIGAGMMVGWPS